MAEVDTSIYKTTPPPAFDPLKTFGQVVGISNAQGQNRLLQQQQDLRSGMTDAYRQAWDPVTQQVDANKLAGIVTQDPRTGWNSGDVIAQSQGNVTAAAQAQQEQLKNIIAHTQAANSIITATMSDPGLGKVDLRDKIVQGINDMSAHGDSMMTGKKAKELADSVPTDPAGQYQWIQQKAAENSAIQGHVGDILQRTYGSPVTADNGQQIVGGVQRPVNPQAGGGALAMPTQAGVQKVTSPGDNAQLVTVTLQDGTRIMVPRASLPGASGVLPGSGPSTPPNALTTPAATTAPGTLPPGFDPKAARKRADAAVPAFDANRPPPGQVQPGTAPAAAGPILAAPPPGVTESQQADVTKYKADQAAIPAHATNVQSLQKAQVALDALAGPLGTGKGTETLGHLKAVMSSLGIGFNESTLNRDEARKYLTNYAKDQGAAAHSDQQLNAALGSNASTEISNAAALDVVKTNIGRERQAIAQVQEHANPTGIGYGSHASSFATKTDPRAFAWDQYTPAERDKILGTLKKNGGMDKFLKSLEIAHRNNLIPGPPQ